MDKFLGLNNHAFLILTGCWKYLPYMVLASMNLLIILSFVKISL
jgi:hypothetical protein